MSETQDNENTRSQDDSHNHPHSAQPHQSGKTGERGRVSYRQGGASYRPPEQAAVKSTPHVNEQATPEIPRAAKARTTVVQEHPYATRNRTKKASEPSEDYQNASASPHANARNKEQPPRQRDPYAAYSSSTPRGQTGSPNRQIPPAAGANRLTQRHNQNFRQARGLSLPALGIAALALAVVIIGVVVFMQTRPLSITVNGNEYSLGGDKNIQTILAEGWATPSPGDFVAVDGSVLEAGKGEALSALVNGEQAHDLDAQLKSGDTIEINNGPNIVEPSQDTVATIPYEIVEEGVGALHKIEGEGADGIKTTKVGDISGKSIVEDTEAVQNKTYRRYSPNVGDDKVIAFTFDDGPWPDSTDKILDILAEHGAKATFFTIGGRHDEAGKALVKRAHNAGHQICTHSFSHAQGEGKGVDMGLMTPEHQREEIEKGYAAIKETIGAEASRVFRSPGGNFSPQTQKIVGDLIDAEIGWNIDTGDWKRPGAQSIAESMKSAKSGDVVLCHDGGGNRAQTVEALKIALPYLKEQGYQFITMDELLKYPPA